MMCVIDCKNCCKEGRQQTANMMQGGENTVCDRTKKQKYFGS